MTRTVSSVIVAFTMIVTTAPAADAVVPSFQGLGDLPGGSFSSSANGISADGSVAVGGSSSAASGAGSGFSEAFRWTSGGGAVGLGDLPGGDFDSRADATSADGAVVVGGSSTALGREAFRWTSGGGMVGLGDLPGGSFISFATATSPDGSVIVGSGNSASGGEAFRWTSAGGMAGLGDLPGGTFGSSAIAVSADGEVVVGLSVTGLSGANAFRWTAGGGMVSLGDLGGGGSPFDRALAVSGDGSVVVGQVRSRGSPQEAFVWDAHNGMRPLLDVLVNDLGLDLTGWQLRSASGISADGMTIVGTGINPDGFGEAWIATLPEPATLSLLAFGGLVVLRRRR